MSFVYDYSISDILEQQFSLDASTDDNTFGTSFENEATSFHRDCEEQNLSLLRSAPHFPEQGSAEGRNIFKRPVAGTTASLQENTGNTLPYLALHLEKYNQQAIDTLVLSNATELDLSIENSIPQTPTAFKSDYKELSLLIATEELKSVVPSTKMFSKLCRQRVLQEGTILISNLIF
ncbi:hypothetical protein MDAP_001416 [Mitosporidium daphniae]